MGRSPCCSREGLNRGAWTPLEDKILTDYITSHGEGKWRSLPKRAGLKRCGKSCRLRWLNYLRPDIKRGNITPDEEDLIIRLHKLLGNRWSLIAGRLPGRTDNEIKNYWNTTIGRRLQAIDQSSTESRAKKKPLPTTKQPKQDHLQHEGSSVVRTKASRCSKVFINSDLQQIGIMQAQHKTIEETISVHTDDIDALDIQPILTNHDHHLSSENSSNDDFMMMDFLVDDIDFLTNLLDNDFFMPPPPQPQPQPRIDHAVSNTQICIGGNSSINEIDDANDVFSPNSYGLLFSSRHGDEPHDEFHGVEFGSMNMMSIFDTCTTLDWIQDQPSI